MADGAIIEVIRQIFRNMVLTYVRTGIVTDKYYCLRRCRPCYYK